MLEEAFSLLAHEREIDNHAGPGRRVDSLVKTLMGVAPIVVMCMLVR